MGVTREPEIEKSVQCVCGHSLDEAIKDEIASFKLKEGELTVIECPECKKEYEGYFRIQYFYIFREREKEPCQT